jgi:predicted RNA-binding protein with PIN domain
VLHASGVLRQILQEDGLRAYTALIMLCERFIQNRNNSFSIVFDGFPPGSFSYRNRSGKIYFSHKNTADSVIKNLIEKNNNPKLLIIVSNDIDIRNYARTYACDILTAEQFLQASNRSSPDSIDTDKPIRDDTPLSEWLKLFNEN